MGKTLKNWNKPSSFTSTTLSVPANIGGVLINKIESNAFANTSTLTQITLAGNTGNYAGSPWGADSSKIVWRNNGSSPEPPVEIVDKFTYNDGSPDIVNNPATITTVTSNITGVVGKSATLQTVSLPICTSIGQSAFEHCTSLTTASFPECTSIGSQAFYNCTSLTTIAFPKCISIVAGALTNTAISNWDGMNPNHFGQISGALYELSNASTLLMYAPKGSNVVSFSEFTSIGRNAFEYCTSLTTVSFSECTIIGSAAFGDCSSMTTVDFPKCTTISDCAFQYCYSLTTVDFPVCTSIPYYAFAECSKLTTASFPECTSIGKYAFISCKSLTTVYIGTSISTVCTLSNSNAFSYCTALTSIYVPASLVNSYKSATNWSKYSSKIVGI